MNRSTLLDQLSFNWLYHSTYETTLSIHCWIFTIEQYSPNGGVFQKKQQSHLVSGTPTFILRLFKNLFLRAFGASVPVRHRRTNIGLGDRLVGSAKIIKHAISES